MGQLTDIIALTNCSFFRLRRQYSQIKDPAVKARINQLQKQVKQDLRVEMEASWGKFCNSVSLESDSRESWRKIKNFLKPKGQHDKSP